MDELQNEEGSIHRAMLQLKIPELNKIIGHVVRPDAITALHDPQNELGNPKAEGELESTWDVADKQIN